MNSSFFNQKKNHSKNLSGIPIRPTFLLKSTEPLHQFYTNLMVTLNNFGDLLEISCRRTKTMYFEKHRIFTSKTPQTTTEKYNWSREESLCYIIRHCYLFKGIKLNMTWKWGIISSMYIQFVGNMIKYIRWKQRVLFFSKYRNHIFRIFTKNIGNQILHPKRNPLICWTFINQIKSHQIKLWKRKKTYQIKWLIHFAIHFSLLFLNKLRAFPICVSHPIKRIFSIFNQS